MLGRRLQLSVCASLVDVFDAGSTVLTGKKGGFGGRAKKTTVEVPRDSRASRSLENYVILASAWIIRGVFRVKGACVLSVCS